MMKAKQCWKATRIISTKFTENRLLNCKFNFKIQIQKIFRLPSSEFGQNFKQ